MSGSILPLADVVELLKEAREEGKIIVTTNGTFDLFHPGHEFLLSEAKKQGDLLVVGINSNASVKRYKGEDRPIESQKIRAENVAQIADYVFIFEEDTPVEWLREIAPDVHANAETYGTDCIEAPVLKEIGATLYLVPVNKDLGSTSDILNLSS